MTTPELQEACQIVKRVEAAKNEAECDALAAEIKARGADMTKLVCRVILAAGPSGGNPPLSARSTGDGAGLQARRQRQTGTMC